MTAKDINDAGVIWGYDCFAVPIVPAP